MRTTLFFIFLTLIHFHNTLNKEGIWTSSFINQKPKHKGTKIQYVASERKRNIAISTALIAMTPRHRNF